MKLMVWVYTLILFLCVAANATLTVHIQSPWRNDASKDGYFLHILEMTGNLLQKKSCFCENVPYESFIFIMFDQIEKKPPYFLGRLSSFLISLSSISCNSSTAISIHISSSFSLTNILT